MLHPFTPIFRGHEVSAYPVLWLLSHTSAGHDRGAGTTVHGWVHGHIFREVPRGLEGDSPHFTPPGAHRNTRHAPTPGTGRYAIPPSGRPPRECPAPRCVRHPRHLPAR